MGARTVRRIRPGESEAFKALRLRALAQSPEAFGSTFDHESAYTDEHWADWAARLADSDDEVLFVAVGDGWVGMAGGYFVAHRERTVSVWGMWVAPDGRLGGVGRELLDALADWALRRGSRRLEFGVMAGNSTARAFYERLGFVVDPKSPVSDRCEITMARAI